MLNQSWALEIFLITLYITFKHIKDKDSILTDSLTWLQRIGLYEKWPCEDEQNQEVTIFDEGESVKVTADPDSFSPPDLNMILSVSNKSSVNEDHDIDKDTFVLNYITYMIDDRHPSKPQIYLTPQQVKRMQLHDQSLAIIIHRLKKDKVCSTALLNTYSWMMTVYYFEVGEREYIHSTKNAMTIRYSPWSMIS